ncbi:MAG: hypothetical protein C5B50_14325 [Verrucomicrobia bacterium]|nr:MAG: hypothetical protein C5B50_14325 [Verrucomicrobiota bacterium]
MVCDLPNEEPSKRTGKAQPTAFVVLAPVKVQQLALLVQLHFLGMTSQVSLNRQNRASPKLRI